MFSKLHFLFRDKKVVTVEEKYKFLHYHIEAGVFEAVEEKDLILNVNKGQ